MRGQLLVSDSIKFINKIKKENIDFKISCLDYFLKHEDRLINELNQESFINIRNQRHSIMIQLFIYDFKRIMKDKDPYIANKLENLGQRISSENRWRMDKHIKNGQSLTHELKIDVDKLELYYELSHDKYNQNKNILNDLSIKLSEITKKNIEVVCEQIIKNTNLEYKTVDHILKNISFENDFITKIVNHKNNNTNTVDLFSKEYLILKAFEEYFTKKEKLPVLFLTKYNTNNTGTSIYFKNESEFLNSKNKDYFLRNIFKEQNVKIDIINNQFVINKHIQNTKGIWNQTICNKQFSFQEYNEMREFLKNEYDEYFKIGNEEEIKLIDYYKNIIIPLLKDKIHILSFKDISVKIPDFSKTSLHDLKNLLFPVIIEYQNKIIFDQKLSFKRQDAIFNGFGQALEKIILKEKLIEDKKNIVSKKRL